MENESPSGQSHAITENMLNCIRECTSCHAVCLHTMTVALYFDHLATDNSLVRMLKDCAEICQTSADFMLRGSPLHGLTCDTCARICDECGNACDQYPENENLRACAESCRSCSAACHEMATSAPNWRDMISGL